MNTRRSILLPLLLISSSAVLAQPVELSAPIHGIVLENTDGLDMTLRLIKPSRKRLAVHLAMDDDDISAYKKVVDVLTPHANVVVQILDSEQVPSYGVGRIRRHTTRAMNAFSDKAALWEIGNKLNGSWVDSSPQGISAKAQAIYEVVEKRNDGTAPMFNYWSSLNCYEEDWEATSKYVESLSANLRNVDYAFSSTYETICTPTQYPSSNDLTRTFNYSRGQFNKAAKFDVGEIDTQDENDERKPAILEEKKRTAGHYYGLQQPLYAKMKDRYVGGYSQWYFHRNAIPPEVNDGRRDNLWPTFEGLLEQL